MTLSELYYGAHKSQSVEENLAAISLLTEKVSVVESNDQICARFENSRSSWKSKA